MPAGELVFIKKITVIGILVGALILMLLAAIFWSRPIYATQPTPTPIVTPWSALNNEDGLCRLELGQECDIREQIDGLTTSTLTPTTNPPLDAHEVPTYTLVSITFDRDMNTGTITDDTFYVQHGFTRVAGRVDYIAVSKMAVFYPDSPLQPETTYTATVTTDVQDLVGQPLTERIVWSFTTFSGPVRLGRDIDAAGKPIGGMTVYIGDLHTHSGYTDDAYLPGTPALAFTTARANGLEFMALTGHDTHLNQTRWQEILSQADAATVNGQFVGLRGFEYTNPNDGHLCVLESDTFVTWTDLRYRNLVDFYAWLVAQPNAIGEFNHPGTGFNFHDFAYYGTVDHKILLREISSVYQTLLSLNKGWHVGTLLNSDTHVGDWGRQKYMGVVAVNLTKSAILEAIRARRTFYVSPYGQRMALVMQANGYWMGSAIPNTGTVNFTVTAYDPDHAGKPLNLALYDNGVRTATARLPGATLVTWKPNLLARLGHYYYAEAYHDGWTYPAYTSPIWVERRPTADAGPAQPAAPGALVTLDGRGSSDTDGDVLAYHWTQESGLSVSLNQDSTAQVTFVAPDTPGNVMFRLTVTDPGGLSDTDTTEVTVTEQPILAITKDGPMTVEPGKYITYTLAVTNSGITPATDVVITDAIPAGAHYVHGGTLMPGNVVSWTGSTLAAGGGVTQVSFVVTTTQGIANGDYRVSCAEGVFAQGDVTVYTNFRKIYFPMLMKAF